MNRLIASVLPATLLLFAAMDAHAQTAATAKPSADAAPPVTRAEPAKSRQLGLATKPWTGDFDQMLERRVIRVYSPYSRSLYFVDKGRERGLGAELVRDFERWINQKYAK